MVLNQGHQGLSAHLKAASEKAAAVAGSGSRQRQRQWRQRQYSGRAPVRTLLPSIALGNVVICQADCPEILLISTSGLPAHPKQRVRSWQRGSGTTENRSSALLSCYSCDRTTGK
jgi:hypothetical protein